jgi:hypothetical protein
MPKRRGRELIRGRFVRGSILTAVGIWSFMIADSGGIIMDLKKFIAELTSVFGLRLRLRLLECRS